MFPAGIQEAIDIDSPKVHLKNILAWCRSMGFLTIPTAGFERVKNTSEVEIVKAAVVRKSEIAQLVDDNEVSWGLLPGLFSDLRILTTRSQAAYESLILHPQCTRVRFFTPQHGFVMLFKDPNRQNVNFVAPAVEKQFGLCRDIYQNNGPRFVSVQDQRARLAIRLPTLAVMTGFFGDDIYALYQREQGFFRLPAPDEIGSCLNLLSALSLSRSAMTTFHEARMLRFAVGEVAF